MIECGGKIEEPFIDGIGVNDVLWCVRAFMLQKTILISIKFDNHQVELVWIMILSVNDNADLF